MAKKTTKKSQASKSPSVSARTNNNSGNSNGILIAILVLVIVQLILSVSVVTMFSAQGEKLESTNEKVDALDTFFTNFVPEYSSGSGAQVGDTTTTTPQTQTGDPSIEGEPTLGSADAPVTIVEFSDYECPYCKSYFDNSHAQLKEDYIEKGLVKLVFKDFPLGFHPLAEPAAVAANCVYNQLGDESYFEYHDMIFTNQQTLSVNNLRMWAMDVDGLDMDTWDVCIEDPSVAAEVQADLAEGANLGVTGTPSFFINGELVVGAVPYAQIKAMIEQKLAE